ncbi:C-C motif chemokine 21b-like [Engystomops pustulosus]|uniref:C-C motif chemokine 21b-like n=1 Tax=Engystomops pustulosus TaxID=76066 RepID=UPI003AFAE9FA
METTPALLILGLLLCHLLCLQGASPPVQDCCLQTSVRRIPYVAIAGYEIQSKDQGCPIEAVVFLTNTRPSRKLCASAAASWVKKWIKKLEKRKKETENKPKKSEKRPQE